MRIFATVLVALSAFFGAASFVPPKGTEWWTGSNGNKYRTRYNKFSFGKHGITKNATLLWSTNIASSLSTPLSPVIYNSHVFLTGSNAAGNCTVGKFVELSGELVATTNLGHMMSCFAPTVDPDTGLVFVQTVGSDEGTSLFALESNTMKVQWIGQADCQWPEYPFGVAAHDGIVYMPAGEYNGVLAAFNQTDGSTVFVQSLYSTDFGCDTWGPTISRNGKEVLWNSCPGEGNYAAVGALDAKTGNVTWTHNYPQVPWAGYSAGWNAIALESGYILGFPGLLTLTSLSSKGHTTWSHNFTTVVGDFATDETTVYFCNNQTMTLVNHKTGDSTELSQSCGQHYAGPIVTDDVVLFSTINTIFAYDKSTKEVHPIVWDITGDFYLGFHGGWLFVVNRDANTLSAYQLRVK